MVHYDNPGLKTDNFVFDMKDPFPFIMTGIWILYSWGAEENDDEKISSLDLVV